jgi:uncharacterized protein (TIGR00645 family)
MLKRLFEYYLLMSRWLLAPFLVMMTLCLAALMVNAAKKTLSVVTILAKDESDHVTLEILNIIDVTLTGALLVLVSVSVYENFVSRVSNTEISGWPDWMGSIDFSQLKLKLLSTIVAISAIKLLEAFMDLAETSDRDLYFYMGIHLTFVASTVAFALGERLSSGHGSHGEGSSGSETYDH